MDYQVSSQIREIYSRIMAISGVETALTFAKENEPETIQNLIDLTLIEAPTFHEAKRAQYLAELFQALGLTDVTIDRNGVVSGVRKGTGDGPRVVMDGHMDTVFPIGTVKEIRREGDALYAPGIGDDTAALAMMLGVIRALNAGNVQTKGDLVFTGTPREEGMGMLGGMRDYLADNHAEVDAVIAIDGQATSTITYEGTGMRTAEVNFYGIGGHAAGAFGKMANALNAAGRAVAKIAEIRVPTDPWTTFCVSNFHAGNDAGIHAIVPQATIKYNIRSNSEEVLAKLDEEIARCIQAACDEETARWGKDTITWDHKLLASAPAGTQPLDAPIIQSLYHLGEEFGLTPEFRSGGCTNASHAIAHNIPTVCMGRMFLPDGFDFDAKVHNLDEGIYVKDYYKCVQTALLLALMCTGIDGETDSVL